MKKEYTQFVGNNVNLSKLTSLVNRVVAVNECIVIEFKDGEAQFQSALETRGAVKYDAVDASELFEFEGDLPDLIIPIENSKRLTTALKMFNEDADNTITFNYLEIDGDLIVNDFSITESDHLNIEFKCAEFQGVIYLDENTRNKLFDVGDSLAKFDVTEATIIKMNKLFDLDSTKEFVEAKSKEDHIELVGETYEYTISDLYEGDAFNTQFSKKYFGFIEDEYSMVHVLENMIVIKSLDSNSITTIGVSK